MLIVLGWCRLEGVVNSTPPGGGGLYTTDAYRGRAKPAKTCEHRQVGAPATSVGGGRV